MKHLDIACIRLNNQSLLPARFKTPHDVVSYLGAVQSQDFAAAKWSVGLRIPGSTDELIEKAYNEGSVLRTHMMRPTWHFVTPQDIRAFQELTSPRVLAMNAHMCRKLELDSEILLRAQKVFLKVLSKTFLTRQELSQKLEENGIQAKGQRLAYIMMHSEVDSLICSGPRKGKQFTYALLDERVPKTKKIPRDETLAILARKYFMSHGPAQFRDFVWWSGLSIVDAKNGINMIKSELAEEVIEDKIYWFSPDSRVVQQKNITAFLLSIYDEYTIAYNDRSALGGERYIEKFIAMGNALTAVIVLNGMVVGTWKRTLKKDSVTINLAPLRALSSEEKEALSVACSRYGEFLGLKTTVRYL